MTSIPAIDQWIAPLEEKFQPLLQRLGKVPSHYWHKLVMAILLLWIITTSGFFITLFLPDNDSTAKKNAASGDTITAEPAVNIDNMVKWHLFGEHNAAVTQAVAPVNSDDGSKDAGKTRLPVQLLGLMYASDPAQARAILLINAEEKQYKVNETLPVGGKVILHKVLVDRVILNNNGNMEALWLFDPDRPRMAQPSSAITPPEMPELATPDSPSAESASNGPLAQSAVQIVPAWGNDGKLQGYRISRGANSAAFDALGFSDGDIVTKINNVQMNNPQNAIKLYQQMQRGGQATFEVMRDGQPVSFQTSLTENNLFSPEQSGEAPEEVPDETSTSE